jgi:hypothetical protein
MYLISTYLISSCTVAVFSVHDINVPNINVPCDVYSSCRFLLYLSIFIVPFYLFIKMRIDQLIGKFIIGIGKVNKLNIIITQTCRQCYLFESYVRVLFWVFSTSFDRLLFWVFLLRSYIVIQDDNCHCRVPNPLSAMYHALCMSDSAVKFRYCLQKF